MKVYLDMSALKRPFDDQTQGRIWLEAQAVIRMMNGFHARLFELCNSEVLLYENDLNPNLDRRDRVSRLLETFGGPRLMDESVLRIASNVLSSGIKALDALHLACAVQSKVDYFITCDDELLKRASRVGLPMRITDPITFVKEVNI